MPVSWTEEVQVGVAGVGGGQGGHPESAGAAASGDLQPGVCSSYGCPAVCVRYGDGEEIRGTILTVRFHHLNSSVDGAGAGHRPVPGTAAGSHAGGQGLGKVDAVAGQENGEGGAIEVGGGPGDGVLRADCPQLPADRGGKADLRVTQAEDCRGLVGLAAAGNSHQSLGGAGRGHRPEEGATGRRGDGEGLPSGPVVAGKRQGGRPGDPGGGPS